MFHSTRIMSDYLATIADLDTYGCDPMSIEGLRDEFEVFPIYEEEFEGFTGI
ncbi:hypothetical protein [Metarhizobium album]|uniref:hypothetical protein n=1 Tax=Metarhizobium album TaxID=2182425 RepID=UPI001401C469|nr:hypothetical protein [Rhizobium album]